MRRVYRGCERITSTTTGVGAAGDDRIAARRAGRASPTGADGPPRLDTTGFFPSSLRPQDADAADGVDGGGERAPPDVEDPQRERQNQQYRKRKETNKHQKERVVKKSLPGHLRNKEGLLPEILRMVEVVSKEANRGSLVFLALLNWCLAHKREIPPLTDTLIRQCFTHGTPRANTTCFPTDFVAWLVDNFPVTPPDDVTYTSQAITYAVNKFLVNIKNSLFMTFYPRQRGTLFRWLDDNGFRGSDNQERRRLVDAIQCAINRPTLGGDTEVPVAARPLVTEHRAILGLGPDDHVSEDWLKNHPSDVFKYFHHILQDMEDPIGRQRRSLRTWVKKHDAFKGRPIEEQENAVRAIQSAINGHLGDEPVPPAATAMVAEHRAIVDPPPDGGVTRESLAEGSPEGKQKFKEHLQRLNDMGCGDGARRFSLAPIAALGSRFITIDIKVLHDMMRHARLTDEPLRPNFQQRKDYEFRAAFDLRRLETGPWKFSDSHLIETDGVSMCVHLRRNLTLEEIANAERTKSRQQKRPRGGTRDPAAPAPEPIRDVDCGGDPGRVRLMSAVKRHLDGTTETYEKHVLTRRSYYSRGGIDQHNARVASWRRDVATEEGIYARHSPRTASLPELVAFLDDYKTVHDTLWNNRLRRCWGQSRFRAYGLKRKTLDRFFRGIRGDSEVKPLFAYGAGRFAPTGPGERAVPTTALAKACARYFVLIMIDEFRTSQMCHACRGRLQAVRKRSADGTIHEVRGLRRCCSTGCARVSFKDRDHNAALNILRCSREAQRPQYLSRDTEHPQPLLRNPFFMLRGDSASGISGRAR